jgi:hypothetical protein
MKVMKPVSCHRRSPRNPREHRVILNQAPNESDVQRPAFVLDSDVILMLFSFLPEHRWPPFPQGDPLFADPRTARSSIRLISPSR